MTEVVAKMTRPGRPLGLIGVPTSAGAFAPGQEQAPRALRDAGLVEALERSGISVHDHGDGDVWRWRPDRARPRAQNLEQVVAIVRDTADRVAGAVAADEVTLVLGGDCTVGMGTVSGHVDAGGSLGLIYFDAHADLNLPDAVPEGALDWMGLAHMLGETGAAPELANAGARAPLLDPEQVVLFGWDPGQATDFEREAIGRLALPVVAVDEVAAGPERAATRARELVESRCDRLLVHFDVDVIDFTDVPLSENWGRNQGLAYDSALRALRQLLTTPRLAGLTVTELNPDHAEQGANTLGRFATDLSRCIAEALPSRSPANRSQAGENA
jgi:arginase